MVSPADLDDNYGDLYSTLIFKFLLESGVLYVDVSSWVVKVLLIPEFWCLFMFIAGLLFFWRHSAGRGSVWKSNPCFAGE